MVLISNNFNFKRIILIDLLSYQILMEYYDKVQKVYLYFILGFILLFQLYNQNLYNSYN